MEKNNRFFNELLSAFGWEEIISKNPYMKSYWHDDYEIRMNNYFSTGTITIQGEKIKMETWKDINSDEQIESILWEISQKN